MDTKPDNCDNHKRDLFGEPDMKVVAEAIGDLHYESLALLFYHLSKKFDHDALRDYLGGKEKTSSAVSWLGASLYESAKRAERVWNICRPFMKPKS